jgi:hypothetical protein
MNLGRNWLRQAERAAAVKADAIIKMAERRLSDLLPDGRIDRDGATLRISARRLLKRWLADPALRFLAWTLK